jgi:hypothetical protein
VAEVEHGDLTRGRRVGERHDVPDHRRGKPNRTKAVEKLRIGAKSGEQRVPGGWLIGVDGRCVSKIIEVLEPSLWRWVLASTCAHMLHREKSVRTIHLEGSTQHAREKQREGRNHVHVCSLCVDEKRVDREKRPARLEPYRRKDRLCVERRFVAEGLVDRLEHEH